MNMQNSAIFGTWNAWEQPGYYFLSNASKWCYQCGTTQVYGNTSDTNRHIIVFNNNQGKLVRYFIPCYSTTSGTIGMYDTVEEKFYTNQGTGTFGYETLDGTYVAPINN